jgi:hypothetical protein
MALSRLIAKFKPTKKPLLYHKIELDFEDPYAVVVLRMRRSKDFEDMEQQRWVFDARLTQFMWLDAQMQVQKYTKQGDQQVRDELVVIQLGSKDEADHLQPQLQEILDAMLENINT